ncbi:hypothetical protein EHS25_008854 [Saitozyma podzolica]|uniref:Uncharacterized protein n=1 Tax=Saitozyma podzolica TaxID=1890683 RepID=A0A427YN13_9TREE|nr:hypothetical protein EHS25_008854 [Saitozyma podzolica]
MGPVTWRVGDMCIYPRCAESTCPFVHHIPFLLVLSVAHSWTSHNPAEEESLHHTHLTHPWRPSSPSRDAFDDDLATFGAKVDDLKDSLDKAETVPWHEVIGHISAALNEFKAAEEQVQPLMTSHEALSAACKSVEPSQHEKAKSVLECSLQDLGQNPSQQDSPLFDSVEATSTIVEGTSQAGHQFLTNTESD